ncbi:acylneuraminate cytidylyltransferase family protein [Thalassospira alkalitolerans]|uniref:acylneuraminate cytidylyltransferase family protein n=1 Tax=Thalassospira alkalitolerans TaxID=1293890 RepID=UPI0030EBC413
MNILALIPARGGSKRVPRKNLATCGGQPLIAWTIKAAVQSVAFRNVIISTDDSEMARVGQLYGAEYLGARPVELSEDQATMHGVLQYELKRAEEHFDTQYDAVALLQPTSPLRNSIHIQQAVKLFTPEDVGSVVSVCKPPHQFHPWKLLEYNNGVLKPFMKSPYQAGGIVALSDNVFGRNGPAILITSSKYIRRGEIYGEPIVPYIMDEEVSLDVDTIFDFRIADLILSQRKN